MCPICEKENPLDNTFCQYCGVEMGKVLPGFTLSQSNALRDVFMEMGWWDDPDRLGGRSLWSLLEAQGLPTVSEAPAEHWIFCAALGKSDWKIDQITVNDKKFGGGWGQAPAVFVIATRCRIMIANLTERGLFQHPYAEIRAAQLQGKEASIRFTNNDLLTLRVNTKGPRTLDVLRQQYWSFSDNTAERYLAGQAVGAKRAAQQDFMAVVADFLDVIARFQEPAAVAVMA